MRHRLGTMAREADAVAQSLLRRGAQGSLRYRGHQSGEVIVNAGDFILIPFAQDFMMWSEAPSKDIDMVIDPVILPGGGYRVGSINGPIDMRALVGYCIFQSDDASLLSALLPKLVVARGEHRLTMLMQLLGEEAVGNKPGREVVLQHLLEVLLIEALRSTAEWATLRDCCAACRMSA